MPTQRHILRLCAQLLDLHPVIWRRIEIRSDLTFWALHVALQNAMGWTDSHLHDFELPNADAGEPVWIGMPDLDGDDYRDVHPRYPLPPSAQAGNGPARPRTSGVPGATRTS